jgi:hypothetical protein
MTDEHTHCRAVQVEQEREIRRLQAVNRQLRDRLEERLRAASVTGDPPVTVEFMPDSVRRMFERHFAAGDGLL